ncbi:hypothetical protein RB195_017533 [Necator americanus]|uniref:Lysine-specific demethylase 6A/B-like C-terminal helical domain-containing protein n=1 Tax=Necator americanus TaxID=51031 RepID=A0ABR1C9C0_NECAM
MDLLNGSTESLISAHGSISLPLFNKYDLDIVKHGGHLPTARKSYKTLVPMQHLCCQLAKKIRFTNQVFSLIRGQLGSINECTVQRWFQKFRADNTSLEDEPHGSRPLILDNDLLKATVEADLGKLTLISSAHLLRNENDPFLERIVICDEKWILYDNRRRPAQWLGQKEAPRNQPKPKTHQKKIIVTVWWSAAGMIHYTFLNPGETITAEKYCQQIDEMHQKLRSLCPALINRKGAILLHDNARPLVSLITRQKLHGLNYETLDHSPYSTDVSPTDFHFFKHLDNFLREKHFRNKDDAETAFDEFIASRTPDFYDIGIKKPVSR